MSSQELIMVHVILAFSSVFIGTLGKLLRPEEPNSLMGYRTTRSMKSQAAWKFSNEYAGNMLAWSAIVAITIQVFAYFILEPLPSVYVAVGASTLGTTLTIGLTEYRLRKDFDKEGNAKSVTRIEDRF